MRVLALVAALLATGWSGVAAQSRYDPVETMTKVAHELGLQTAMPRDEPPPKPPDWSDFHWHIPEGLAEWVTLGALALGLGFAVFALRDTLPGISRRTRIKPDAAMTPLIVDSVERMHVTGDDADELARRGLLAEAMHMLLLRSLIELRKRLDVTLADSLTSREILQRLADKVFGQSLPELGHRALADLIQRVEFVHFGRDAAGPEDYAACRASYERLIGAMGMGPPLAAAA